MATTIMLARHGETDWNHEHRWQGHADPPLNATGRAQANALATELARKRPQRIYSSDLLRARETAEVVAVALGLTVVLDERLREVDVGEWSGLTMAEVERLYPEGVLRRREGGTGWTTGESFADMRRRIAEVLHAIGASHAGERVVVISHGGPLVAAWLEAGGTYAERPVYGNCDVEILAVSPDRIRRRAEARGAHALGIQPTTL